MTDYRTILERDLGRVGPAGFTVDDVARRRDRKQRNRRIGAGVVALALAVLVIGGWLGAITLDSSTPAEVTPAPDPFLGVWTSVMDDGTARLLEIRDPSHDRAHYTIRLYEDDAHACGGGVGTADGIGETGSGGHVTFWPRVLTCVDGKVVVGSRSLAYDPATDTLVDSEGSTWTRALAHARDPDPQPRTGPDVGIWPQASVAEAEEAQRGAAGKYWVIWQIEQDSGSNVDGQQVAKEFIRGPLGLSTYYHDELGVPERGAYGPSITWTFVLCEPGEQNLAYPNVACAPADGDRFPAIDVTVEQLAREGVGGIWVVTGWGPSDFVQSEPPTEQEIRRFLGPYVQARIAGSGADPYLGPYPDDRLRLYATRDGSPFVRYEIEVSTSEPRWPTGMLYPTVRLIAGDGTVVEESYLIGPEQITTGELNWVYFTTHEIKAPG